ncbi:hypothetical protein LSH36_726g01008 [Paralvinella palmiformis]|uniref:EF-hand domain-containing protein n=1 Tax=Paralvinella palmiformis TaxID=53620 RepID=A0AAD9MVT1_9ANNE|nr:hypothetical protein LSH36_726g01008 [Paralvinella palmiformis]
MYDKDNNGLLDRHEVTDLIGSMVEMANSDLSREETVRLVEHMFQEAGINKCSAITPDDFAKVFQDQMDMFRDVHLDFKGRRTMRRRLITLSGSAKRKKTKPSSSRSKVPSFQDATMPNELPGNGFAKHLYTARQFVENHRQHIVYMFVFYAICVMLFFERYYTFSVEKEHMGLRSLTGYGLSVTRGAAASMSFTFSLLLLTMCRNIITVLRETVLNHFIPFDDHVAFHKHVAYVALFFTDILPDLNYWLYRTLVGFTGILLCVIVCIIYTFANQLARRHIFNAFWITHQLFYILYILILLHG